jgi:hypothetical protein
MFKNTNAAVGNVGKAGGQIAAANMALVNGQPGTAVRMVNSAASKLANANNQFNIAAQQAKNAGLNKAAFNLKNAANKVKQAKLAEALKHAANAVKAMSSNQP